MILPGFFADLESHLTEKKLFIYEGKQVKVWWPADNCSYGAVVDKLSSSEIELVYDDGMRKSYPRDEAILSRITIGEVAEHTWVCTRDHSYLVGSHVHFCAMPQLPPNMLEKLLSDKLNLEQLQVIQTLNF